MNSIVKNNPDSDSETHKKSDSFTSPLFRPEVSHAKRSNLLGQVILIRPISFQLYTLFALFAILVVFVFLYSYSYEKRFETAGFFLESHEVAENQFIIDIAINASRQKLALIKPSQKIHIRFNTSPSNKNERYEGMVKLIEHIPYSLHDLQSLTKNGETLYRVQLTLNKQSEKLFQANHIPRKAYADIEVFLGKQRLLDWVFNPFLSNRGSL